MLEKREFMEGSIWQLLIFKYWPLCFYLLVETKTEALVILNSKYLSFVCIIAFSSAAPAVWNALPVTIREAPAHHIFKKQQLKTILFSNAYNE